MRPRLLSLVVPLLLCAATNAVAQELSAEDREMLEDLLRGTIVDPPPTAERVVVASTLRTVWASTEEVERDAWLVPAAADRPAQLLWVDGRSAPAPANTAALERVDLAASVRELLRPRGEEEERDERFGAMARAAGRGPQTDHDLALAAWLHRRGEDALAAALLTRLRARQRQGQAPDASLAAELKGELAWEAFAGMVHAYMVRADDEALDHGERLLSRYPEQARGYLQAETLVSELRRRKTKGTFGQTSPGKPPEGFESRSPEEQVAWLLDALEEVDARQFGQPGGVDLASDWRVTALIVRGEVAVPALIDSVENDPRLTRSVHFWRDFSRSRTVLSVREAALVAAMSILRVQVFEPSSTGDNFTAADPAKAKDTARRLREYWERNQGLTLEQRMLRVLTTESSSQEQMREAAQNLAELTGQRRIGTTVWGTRTEPGRPGAPNPALTLTDPTAAEAILAAMDRDLVAGDPHWKDDARMALFTRRPVETHYVECLILLEDRRILPELRRRAEQAVDMRMRRQWALACHAHGDPAPMSAFLQAFTAGSLTLPSIVDPGRGGHLFEQPGAVELRQCVETFTRLGTPEAEQALRAATEAAHPYRDAFALLVSRGGGPGSDSQSLFAHPYYLALLVPELDRTEPTGSTFRLEGNTLHEEGNGGSSTMGFDPSAFGGVELEAKVAERLCDRAARRLSQALVGLPAYHPLMKDRDARLARLKASCARLVRSARRAMPSELEALGLHASPWNVVFIPDLAPLGRVATEVDVAAGRAVFHLAGKGTLVDMALPAAGQLAVDGQAPVPVLVVQAEALPSGERRYGVLGANTVEEVGADRLTGIEALPDPAAQRAAAVRLIALASSGDVDGVRGLLGPDALAQIEQFGGVAAFVEQVRQAIGQVPEEQLVEAIAPGFRAGADGVWRLERLR